MNQDAVALPEAVRFAVGHLNLSARHQTTPAAFLAALRDHEWSAGAEAALEAFLNEADPAEIADLVAAGASDFASLSVIAGKLLPRSHPNRILLDDLAA